MRTETAEVIPLIRQQLPPAPREPKDRKNSAWKKKPKSNGLPGTHGYRWSPAQRKKFLATAARKQAQRLKEERDERRLARLGRKAGPLPKGARRPSADVLGGIPSRSTAAQVSRAGKAGSEERLDAIVYLARAYAAYEGIPDDALLGLLALRTLQGRIK